MYLPRQSGSSHILQLSNSFSHLSHSLFTVMPQCIDPASLSNSPSPAPTLTESSSSRKRSRSDISPDDRREARAHRNRIAAQNSRDRRKAHFSYLERRVAELEEENRLLRAGMPLPLSLSTPVPPPATAPIQAHEDSNNKQPRDRENEELKQRIKSLENGWDIVMRALTAQGVSLSPNPTPTPTPTPSTSTSMSYPNPILPISPAPSHTSLDFDSSPSEPVFSPSASSPQPQPPSDSDSSEHEHEQKHEPTRHLARVATIGVQPMSLQRVASTLTSTSPSFSTPPALTRARLLKAQTQSTTPLTRQSTTRLWRISSERYSPRSHLLLQIQPLPRSLSRVCLPLKTRRRRCGPRVVPRRK